MFQQREVAKKVLAKYTKVEDPGMLEGSLKYAHDFTEKIPLVKREGVQVVLEQEATKNPKVKEFTAEQFYDNGLGARAGQRRVLQIPPEQMTRS